MANVLLLVLLSVPWATAGLQSSDHLVKFALLGDSITLPCAKHAPSVRLCSSVNWNMAEQFQSVTEVVKAGRVTSPDRHRLVLLNDCSLQINHLMLNDARLYTCDSGTRNSSVSLQILEINENKRSSVEEIELQCFLNTYKGHGPCNITGIHIKWSTEDSTPIKGNRFRIENPSGCFSKLIIKKKLTDHHRKWKCQLTQNDVVKASISHSTSVFNGIEEVFATVGESVSLSCSNISSPGVSMMWAVGGRLLTDNSSHDKGQSGTFHVNQDSSLVISSVSALHGGDYQCSDPTNLQVALTKIRLHILDVTSEHAPGGDTLNLTCVLICAKECEEDFNLTWSESSQNSWQSGLMHVNNTLINKLFLPVRSAGSDEITCSVRREDAVMASKRWSHVNPLQTLAWLAVPVSLLTCIAAGGLCLYMKRKRNKDAGHEQSSFRMTHVYEDIQHVNNEELQQQRPCKREAAATDGFYQLLQPVN
ncbi:uncharacterized protein LOC113170208 isoform X1 [Anabas testudineus]|uniref:uncharacterized protein LOC113170208 isoform X1 n=1 Tax=Anabas testudineus TaxID=64144 RepID=UPI000E45EF0F|nr:uncharacterized protein LOC113170208 isoform X1 [Anabas testudineus]